MSRLHRSWPRRAQLTRPSTATTPDARPVFDLHSVVDPTAPQISTDMRECQHVMPGSTTPYLCSRILAQRIAGSPPGAEACDGGSARVP